MTGRLSVGLTGSIGMGKSTTAALFAEAGVPVYDADAAVHRVYGPQGAAVEAVEALFPGVSIEGAIDRARLSARVLGDQEALRRLEHTVHPLLGADRAAFLDDTVRAPLIVLDIPLLFETRGETAMDAVVVVSAPEAVQRARVMARVGMSAEKLDAILARQTPDAEKRRRADFLIDTGGGIDTARRQVGEVLATLADPAWRSLHAADRAQR
jgi:dephospho-CoA kinase